MRDQVLCRSLGQRVLPRVETVLRQYGVSVSDRRYMHTTQPINARLMLGRISYGDGLYYFELSRTGRVHAIAAQREGDRYHLFDCHYGHFRVDGLRNFAILLDRFLRQTDYERVYDKGTTVAGAGAVARWRVLDIAAMAQGPMRPMMRPSRASNPSGPDAQAGNRKPMRSPVVSENPISGCAIASRFTGSSSWTGTIPSRSGADG